MTWEAFDGTTAWSQDQNGRVTDRSRWMLRAKRGADVQEPIHLNAGAQMTLKESKR